MGKKVFRQQLTLGSRCALVLFALLVVYLFWVRLALVGLLVVIVIVGMIERILHTTYTFVRIKPIDRDEEMEFLVVDKGRFSVNQHIPLCDITRCTPMRPHFGLSHYLLIEYGANRMVAVRPADEQKFVEELTKRQNAEDASVATQQS